MNEELQGSDYVSDREGVVKLDASAASESINLTLWVSHAEHLSQVVAFPRNQRVVEVELQSCRGLVARVVDSMNGEPIAAAEILQEALVPSLALEARQYRASDPREDIHIESLSLFSRAYVSDSDGRAHIHPCGFPVALSARFGERASALAIAHPGDEEIELRIAPTTRAFGTVRLPANFSGLGELRVLAFEQTRSSIGEGSRILIEASRVSEAGAWGPLELVIDAGKNVAFRLVGGGVVPIEYTLDPRSATRPFIVDFEPEIGLEIPVFVYEQAGASTRGISDARVEFRWKAEGGGSSQRTSTLTDKDGRATITGCPETTGAVRAAAVGYASRVEPSVGLPHPDPLEIELVPGGILEGRCLHTGTPVQNFDVLVWKDSPNDHSVYVFRDRADGSFRIEGAPFGPVQLMVVSSGLSESGVKRAEILPTGVAHIVIELPEGTTAFGRVVDAMTGAGIGGARIVPMISSSMLVIGFRGDSFRTEADGSFKFEPSPAKDSVAWVEAEGYATLRANGSYTDEAGVDFGTVAMSRGQDLLVRLVMNEGIDASGLWVRGDGTSPIPYQQFPASGELLLEGVVPGHVYLHVVWPDGDLISRWVKLVAGRPWIVEFDLRAEEETIVDVVFDEEEGSIPPIALFASYTDSQGNAQTRVRMIPPDHRVVIPDCGALDVWLEVATEVGDLLGFAHARFEPGEPRHTEVVLSSRSLVVSVVDANGDPLPETQIDITTSDPKQPFSIYRAANAEGRAVFAGIAVDEIVVRASHPSHGHRASVPVALEPEGVTEIDLVLNGGKDLHIRVADGDATIAGVEVRLHAGLRSIIVADRQTDAEGVALWARLDPGPYQVHVDHPGLWPTWHAFEFTGVPEPIEVPVRRLGSVRVRVVNVDGLSLGGIPIGLASVEFGATVSSWIDGRLVVAEPGNLVTNAQGEVHVQGIPHGAYVLDLDVPPNAPIHQSIVVPPADTLLHIVALE